MSYEYIFIIPEDTFGENIMVRPKRMRRVVTCHKHELNNNRKPIELSVDEFEAIRFKDYHDIKQTEAAEFMGISQSTFHRILNSARHKMATSLIEGRPIVIVKGDTMIDPNKYLCEDCGFQWSNPEKEYGECPDCKSTNIRKLNTNNRRNQMTNDTCSCPNCGYTEPKIRGVPCRSKTCPECGSPLQGRGLCNI